MLKRRLYLQIYVIILASLATVVVVSAIMWGLFNRNGVNQNALDVVSRLVYMALPPDSASQDIQSATIGKLGRDLDIGLSLFAADKRLIATTGINVVPPPNARRSGWHRVGRGRGWALKLPDERWVVVDLGRGQLHHPLVNLLFYLGSIALAVGLVALPFVRRLTRRLERLKNGVEKIGAGDLSTRVDVEGRDEIAGLARSFNEAAEKIETLVASHRLLLANASHELRTPLSRIRLGVELMMKGRGDPARRAALEQDIGELDTLIDEILLMSRLDAGADGGKEQHENVDFLALVAEECARYEDCTLSGSAARIVGDSLLLRRLVRNLLDNAYKHGLPPVTVSLQHQDRDITLVVTDHGDGIVATDREHVFRPFYRARGKQNTRGFGLGLPLVRQIAEAHGGAADILSNSDGQTEVHVTFGDV